DAAEAEVRGRGVDRLALAGGRAVAQAVVRGAQVRAALDHPARDGRPRLAGDQAVGRRGDPRVAGGAAGVLNPLGRAGGEVVAGPLPDIAGHVVEPEAVRGEALYRGRPAPLHDVHVMYESHVVPGIDYDLDVVDLVGTPSEDDAVQPAAGSELPFQFVEKLYARP